MHFSCYVRLLLLTRKNQIFQSADSSRTLDFSLLFVIAVMSFLFALFPLGMNSTSYSGQEWMNPTMGSVETDSGYVQGAFSAANYVH